MPNNSLTVYQNIPLIDLSKTYSNTDLYEYFKLTNEEINLIENAIK